MSSTSGASGQPVLFMRGSAIEQVTDLSIPGPLGGWTHERTYDSLLNTASNLNQNYNIQGNRWMGGPQSMYLLKVYDSSSVLVGVDLYTSASSKQPFPLNSNGTFTGPADLRATLTKTVSPRFVTYTLTFPDTGVVYLFREAAPAGPCWGIGTSPDNYVRLVERTNLSYIAKGLAGETYTYSNGRVATVVTATPQSYYIQYTYTTVGSLDNKLHKVQVFDSTGINLIAETEYTYVSNNSYSALGGFGALIQVRVSKLMDDGQWDHKYTQYRYHLSMGFQGMNHQLKFILEPDAVERIMTNNTGINTPEDILLKGDSAVLSSGNSVVSYASRSFIYYTSNLTTNGNVTTTWGSENLQTKYGGSERAELASGDTSAYFGRVQSESVHTGCLSCGGSSSGGKKMTYYYLLVNSESTTDPNVVVYMTIEDTQDAGGTKLYRTIYGLNNKGVELRRVVIEDPMAATLNTVCTSKKFNAQSLVVENRSAESHSLVTTNALIAQFLNPLNPSTGSWANDTATLESSKGKILLTEYDSVHGKPSALRTKLGAGGMSYYLQAADYNASGKITADYVYPTQTTNRAATDRVAATYAYTYWDTAQRVIKTQTTTGPTVPTAQNGPNTAPVSKIYYDEKGNLRWSINSLGVVTYYGYDAYHNKQTLTVRDVNTATLPAIITTNTNNIVAWTGAVPFVRSSSLPTALNQTSVSILNTKGYSTATINPSNITSYTVRGAGKTMHFPAWDTTTQKPLLPISVTEVNAADEPVSVYQLPPTAVTVASGKPTGINAGATKNSWTCYTYDPKSGALQHVDHYHTIPASGTGSLGANYNRTTFIYDPQGRQSATAQYAQAGKWQVDAQRFDWRDRTIETRRVAAMNPPSYTDLLNDAWINLVSKTTYDGDRVAKQLAYFDTGANDYTGVNYKYDAWGQIRAAESFAKVGSTETPYGPYTVNDYDWRGNIIASADFETAPNWTTVLSTANFAAATATNRRSLTKSSIDNLGAVFKTETFEVASNGTAGNSATDNYYSDILGRTIAAEQTNHPRNETDYDALGRQIRTRVKVSTAVIAQTETDYDIAGNVIGQHSLDLNAGEVNGITSSSTNYTRRSVYAWYDNAGRQTAEADYGSGGTNWSYYAKPARPSSAPASSSASLLLTKTAYNATTGRLETTTDPAGRNSRTTYNALGQITNQWQNYINGSSTAADQDVETRFTYDGLGSILTMTAVNTTGNQVTKYLYENAIDASLQTNAIYPDSTDTTSSGTDQVKTAYYLDGNVKTITDQNGTLRTFTYDNQRRLTADTVTTLGTNVDGTVRKIGRTYAWNGALASVVSYNASNAILDEIKYEYNANQKLYRLYQSHSGAVNVSTTPYIQYTYSGIADGFRTAAMKYPSGKTLTYGYNARQQLTTIADAGTTLATYVPMGSGNTMQTTYNQPAISLTHANGGIDRFGRIVDHAWKKSTTDLVRIQHGYDYASNRNYRKDMVSTTNSELYGYDGVNQVKSL
ncbi:MAG: hypothetical protein FWE95_09745, partial [Planctomycetaceae bacterium]|nr:hypothetical protein [Planctomycetaceae bacterium]